MVINSFVTTPDGFLEDEKIGKKYWSSQRGGKSSLMHCLKYLQGSTMCSLIRSSPKVTVAVEEGSPHGKTWA